MLAEMWPIMGRKMSIASCMQKRNIQYEPIEHIYTGGEMKTFGVARFGDQTVFVKLGRAAKAERTNLRRIWSVLRKRTVMETAYRLQKSIKSTIRDSNDLPGLNGVTCKGQRYIV